MKVNQTMSPWPWEALPLVLFRYLDWEIISLKNIQRKFGLNMNVSRKNIVFTQNLKTFIDEKKTFES